jgi:hypothetical protein
MLEIIELFGTVLDLLSGIQDLSIAAEAAARFLKRIFGV